MHFKDLRDAVTSIEKTAVQVRLIADFGLHVIIVVSPAQLSVGVAVVFGDACHRGNTEVNVLMVSPHALPIVLNQDTI